MGRGKCLTILNILLQNCLLMVLVSVDNFSVENPIKGFSSKASVLSFAYFNNTGDLFNTLKSQRLLDAGFRHGLIDLRLKPPLLEWS